MRKLFCYLLCCFFSHLAIAGTTQDSSMAQVGKRIQNYTFTNLMNSVEKQISIKDFEGKWLILDLWSLGCASCIASFPKMSKIHEKFKDKVQVIMIGDIDHRNEAKTKQLYEMRKEKYSLQFTVAFDSVYRRKFANNRLMPDIIVVDPAGIVRHITISVTEENIRDLIEGKNAVIYGKDPMQNTASLFDSQKPLLTNGVPANGGVDTAFLYRSLLAAVNSDANQRPDLGSDLLIDGWDKPVFVTGNKNLYQLYKFAYLGTDYWRGDNGMKIGSYYDDIYPQVVLEVKDSADFIGNFYSGKGYYNYSLSVPKHKADAAYMREIMQNDLKNYFGYVAGIEVREMPVFKVITIDKKKVAKLKTSGGPLTYYSGRFDGSEKFALNHPRYVNSYSGFSADNVDFDLWLVRDFPTDAIAKKYKFQLDEVPPVFNATGINFKVDVTIRADEFDFDDIRQAYNKIGLDIVEAKKAMKVIVVRDK